MALSGIWPTTPGDCGIAARSFFNYLVMVYHSVVYKLQKRC